MKNKLLVFFLFVATAVSAQEEYGRRIVKKLASSEYYGRGYVFNGDLKAATFIAKEFKKNGISPLEGSDKDYFQYLTLSPNTFPKETRLQIDGNKLKVGKDFLIDAASKSINGKFAWVKLSTEDYTQKLNNILDN